MLGERLCSHVLAPNIQSSRLDLVAPCIYIFSVIVINIVSTWCSMIDTRSCLPRVRRILNAIAFWPTPGCVEKERDFWCWGRWGRDILRDCIDSSYEKSDSASNLSGRPSALNSGQERQPSHLISF